MKVSEAMVRDIEVVSPGETIERAAGIMATLDAGSLPVGENDRLVGMITDRDIAIRGVARGKSLETKIRDVMTADVKYCYDDQEVDEVARNMGDLQVRRLPVVNREKRLVGLLPLGKIAKIDESAAGDALTGISRKGGQYRQ
jgi:CBS domain-containing protein